MAVGSYKPVVVRFFLIHDLITTHAVPVSTQSQLRLFILGVPDPLQGSRDLFGSRPRVWGSDPMEQSH